MKNSKNRLPPIGQISIRETTNFFSWPYYFYYHFTVDFVFVIVVACNSSSILYSIDFSGALAILCTVTKHSITLHIASSLYKLCLKILLNGQQKQ